MSYLEPTFFLSSLLIVLLLVPLSTVGQSTFLKEFCGSERGNYTDNSAYQTDLDSLLTSFSNTQIEYGFYNSSVGEVNGIGLCRGDLSLETCRTCISNSSQQLRRLCPNYKEAVVYYDQCMLRYSNRSIFGAVETSYYWSMGNTQNFSDIDFSQQRAALLLELRGKAASGGSSKKYATGQTSVDFETIYGLVQCTPDLEYQECYDCLTEISQGASVFLRYRRGGRIMIPSCNLRFETARFYSLLPEAPPPSPPTNDTSTGDGMLYTSILSLKMLLTAFSRSLIIFSLQL